MTTGVQNNFPIENEFESTRLFFVKESASSTVWHICDMALGSKRYANTLQFMALHGLPVESGVRCYTVLRAKLQYGIRDSFCMRCLEEFEYAKEIIERRKLLKFN